MSKTTNKHQIEILLNAMQTHPDIGRGFYKGSKEELNRVWRNLEAELNLAGPPSKNVSEWKRVWIDQKKYVRNKASQNLKAIKETGGGPNMEQTFSATKGAIYKLTAMHESVEGVANTCGLGSSHITKQIPENIPTALLVDDVVKINVPEFYEKNPHQPLAKKKRKSLHSELPTQKSTPADVLAEELCIQKDTCEAKKDQQQNKKNIYRSIDRLYDLQKHHYEAIEKAKKDKLEELKRHNLVMEKLRLRELQNKIEKNRRLLKLEDFKHT